MKRYLSIIALLSLSLIAGQSTPALFHPPQPAAAVVLSVGLVARPVAAISRALIISVDGLRPDVLLRANAPHIHGLYTTGSFSFWARTAALSVTLPSHTSMLTGVFPIHHGVLWNQDISTLRPRYPAVPTLFEIAHNAGYTTAMAVGKSKFRALAKPNTLDWMFIPDQQGARDELVAEEAVEMIREHQPQVLFVHLGGVDFAGHTEGWGTAAQLQAVAMADAAIGEILAALDEQHLRDSTVIIITADHGGAGRGHGPNDARSRHIPWIVNGPDIRSNVDLTSDPRLTIDTQDTFATVCWLLGIRVDSMNLDGKPIRQIVEQTELLRSVK